MAEAINRGQVPSYMLVFQRIATAIDFELSVFNWKSKEASYFEYFTTWLCNGNFLYTKCQKILMSIWCHQDQIWKGFLVQKREVRQRKKGTNQSFKNNKDVPKIVLNKVENKSNKACWVPFKLLLYVQWSFESNEEAGISWIHENRWFINIKKTVEVYQSSIKSVLQTICNFSFFLFRFHRLFQTIQRLDQINRIFGYLLGRRIWLLRGDDCFFGLPIEHR